MRSTSRRAGSVETTYPSGASHLHGPGIRRLFRNREPVGDHGQRRGGLGVRDAHLQARVRVEAEGEERAALSLDSDQLFKGLAVDTGREVDDQQITLPPYLGH